MAVQARRPAPSAARCTHHLGRLPCTNQNPHAGAGRGCVHDAGDVPDRHRDAEPDDQE